MAIVYPGRLHDGVYISVGGVYWAVCPCCQGADPDCPRCKGDGEVRADVGDKQEWAFPVDWFVNHAADEEV
jgi:hypothetical protein